MRDKQSKTIVYRLCGGCPGWSGCPRERFLAGKIGLRKFVRLKSEYGFSGIIRDKCVEEVKFKNEEQCERKDVADDLKRMICYFCLHACFEESCPGAMFRAGRISWDKFLVLLSDFELEDKTRRCCMAKRFLGKASDVLRNLTIFEELRFRRSKIATIRKWFCVYRVWKTYNLPVYAVAELFHIGHTLAMKYIGEAFRWLCLRSDSCWARRLFKS